MLERTLENKRLSVGVVSVAAASILLSACQTAAPSQYGAGDASQDVCYAEHRELANSQNYFAEEIVKGAVTGAILGGLTGAILSGGRGSAIAAGAASGAVAGGTAGYWQARQKDARDRYALAASIHGDLVREIGEIDRVATTFSKVRACRTHHAQQIKAAHRAGQLTREQAQAKLRTLWLQYQSDIEVAESISLKMADRGASYRTASDELVKMEGGTPAAVATNTAQVEPKKTTTTSTTKKTTAAAAPKTVDPASTSKDAQGVAQLTSTNQVKQASFSKDVQTAKADQGQFDLSGLGFGPTVHAYLGNMCVLSLPVG